MLLLPKAMIALYLTANLRVFSWANKDCSIDLTDDTKLIFKQEKKMKDLQYAIYNVINIVKIGENYRTIVHLMIKAHNLHYRLAPGCHKIGLSDISIYRDIFNRDHCIEGRNLSDDISKLSSCSLTIVILLRMCI
jgi:hypothetical protein